MQCSAKSTHPPRETLQHILQKIVQQQAAFFDIVQPPLPARGGKRVEATGFGSRPLDGRPRAGGGVGNQWPFLLVPSVFDPVLGYGPGGYGSCPFELGSQNSKEAARRQCETRCTGPQTLSPASGRADGFDGGWHAQASYRDRAAIESGTMSLKPQARRRHKREVDPGAWGCCVQAKGALALAQAACPIRTACSGVLNLSLPDGLGLPAPGTLRWHHSQCRK